MQITVWRLKNATEPGFEYPKSQVRFVTSLEDALDPLPDAALITCPASEHISIAMSLAEKGIHIFIEKPLSHNLDNIDKLIAMVRRKRLVAIVGYTLRFSEALNVLKNALDEGAVGKIFGFRAEVGQFLPDWRPGVNYAESASAKKSLGGGVVLELSHELDYVRWLFGNVKAVQAVTGRLGDLGIDVEDTAEIILHCNHGKIIGSIHLDMLQRTPVRYCRVFGSEGTLVMNFLDNSVMIFSGGSTEGRYLSKPQVIDQNQMYIDEINHFFTCIKTGVKPLIGLYDGKKVMELVHAIKKSSAEHKVVVL